LPELGGDIELVGFWQNRCLDAPRNLERVANQAQRAFRSQLRLANSQPSERRNTAGGFLMRM
jgi:hypothetical protein